MRLADQLIARLSNRIANLVARGIVRLIDDSTKLQALQLVVGADETRDAVERVQEYGFTSVPLDGAEAVVLFVNGRRDHGLCVAVDDRRYRLKGLASGEVAVYHKDGASIVLKANGSIEVNAKSGSDIVLNGGTEKVSRVGDATEGHTHTFALMAGQVAVSGTIDSSTDTIAEGADRVKA